MSEWQPIETAPKDGTRILIFVPGNAAEFEHYDGIHAARFEAEMMHPETKTGRGILPELNGMWVAGGELWSDSVLEFAYEQPTHWMPLPEPPVT